MPSRNPTDDEVEAYIDGLLEPKRRAEVDAFLAHNPRQAVQIRAMRRQNEALRHLGEDILDEPIPDRLRAVVDPLKRDDQKTERVRGSLVLAPAPRRLA